MTVIFFSQEYVKFFIVNYNIQNIEYYLTDLGRCYYCHEMFVPDKLNPVMKSCTFFYWDASTSRSIVKSTCLTRKAKHINSLTYPCTYLNKVSHACMWNLPLSLTCFISPLRFLSGILYLFSIKTWVTPFAELEIFRN